MAFIGCGGRPEPAEEAFPEPDPLIELPGTLNRPDSSGFVPVETDSLPAILLYLWLPLSNSGFNDPDLVFLAALEEEGVLPAPVQFDQAARNHAQRRINSLGLPLAVYLGDPELLAFMNPEALPLAVLVLPGGTVHRATGAGSARRVLRDYR